MPEPLPASAGRRRTSRSQNKSLQLFAGEAYLVEQGVSNEIFTQERGEPGDRAGIDGRAEPNAGCQFVPNPKDSTNFDTTLAAQAVPSDVVQFSTFMRFLDQPKPAPSNPSIENGSELFNQVGCGLCHTPSMKTSPATVTPLGGVTANLFSDLLVHHMGSGLADNVGQGNAAGDEFRSAPLWGVGQRIFFLHDGRTSDIVQAIEMHSSSGSEANTVIDRFNEMPADRRQDIVNFLRSL